MGFWCEQETNYRVVAEIWDKLADRSSGFPLTLTFSLGERESRRLVGVEPIAVRQTPARVCSRADERFSLTPCHSSHGPMGGCYRRSREAESPSGRAGKIFWTQLSTETLVVSISRKSCCGGSKLATK
jgi:hypothetical protein